MILDTFPSFFLNKKFFKNTNIFELIYITIGLILLVFCKKVSILSLLVIINFLFYFIDLDIFKCFFKVFIKISFLITLFLIISIALNLSFFMQVEYLLKAIFMVQQYSVIFFFKRYKNDKNVKALFNYQNLILLYIITIYIIFISL